MDDSPLTVGGTLATVALLLAPLFVLAAPQTLLIGLLAGVLIGGGAVGVANRRGSTDSTAVCVPGTEVCV